MVFSREIIEDLLTRMPVKTLMRFKCVSKDWNNYISDESFRRHYLSQENIKSNTPRGFICHTSIIDKPQVQSLYKMMYYHELNMFFYTSDKYVEKEELKYLNYLSKIGYVVASSKGLLLLSHTSERFRVYDFISKKYVSLPRNHEVKNFVALGFNCEEKSIKHDIYHHHQLCYKVVCVPLEDEHTLRSSYNVEIYSSETSTWKKSIMKAKQCFSMRPNNIAKVIAGLFHWYEHNLTRIVACDYDDPDGHVVFIECPQTTNNLYHHKKLKKRKTFEGTENGSLQFIEIAEETINVWILKVKDGVNYMDEDIIYANMWNLTYSVSLVDICSGIDSLDLERLGLRLYIIGIDPVDLPVIYFEIEKQIFAYNYYEGRVTFVSLQEIALQFHISLHFEWPTWPCL